MVQRPQASVRVCVRECVSMGAVMVQLGRNGRVVGGGERMVVVGGGGGGENRLRERGESFQTGLMFTSGGKGLKTFFFEKF